MSRLSTSESAAPEAHPRKNESKKTERSDCHECCTEQGRATPRVALFCSLQYTMYPHVDTHPHVGHAMESLKSDRLCGTRPRACGKCADGGRKGVPSALGRRGHAVWTYGKLLALSDSSVDEGEETEHFPRRSRGLSHRCVKLTCACQRQWHATDVEREQIREYLAMLALGDCLSP